MEKEVGNSAQNTFVDVFMPNVIAVAENPLLFRHAFLPGYDIVPRGLVQCALESFYNLHDELRTLMDLEEVGGQLELGQVGQV